MAAKPGNSMNLNSTTPGLVNWDGTATMSTTGLVQYYVMSGAGNNTVNNISPLTAGYVSYLQWFELAANLSAAYL